MNMNNNVNFKDCSFIDSNINIGNSINSGGDKENLGGALASVALFGLGVPFLANIALPLVVPALIVGTKAILGGALGYCAYEVGTIIKEVKQESVLLDHKESIKLENTKKDDIIEVKSYEVK